jgi:hypothetical protein
MTLILFGIESGRIRELLRALTMLWTGGRLLKGFTGIHHCPSKLVQLLDEIDLLVDWKAGETPPSSLFGGEDVL